MTEELAYRLLTSAVECYGDKMAVVDDARGVTYRELGLLAHRFARGLISHGLQRGERVGLQVPNSVEWIVAHWGIALAGCILVPLNTRYRPAEISFMLARSDASAFITGDDADTNDLNTKVFRLGALPRIIAASDAVAESRQLERIGAVRGDDVHMIQFTSGTTGFPKGAMLAERGVVANAHALNQVWRVRAGDAVLIPGPFSHILSLIASCVMAAAGGTLLTMAHFTPERAMELIQQYRAIGMTGTPTHYLSMVEHPERSRYDISSLRFGMHGGAPLTPESARRIASDFGLHVLLAGFGMSETTGGVTSTDDTDSFETQTTTLGRPLSTFQVKIVNPGDLRELGPEETGELWVRGIPVMKGYWNDPEETAKVLGPDGWLRTGDLFSITREGYLRFAGRLKEVIKVGGYSVYPAEIERVLTEQGTVAEAAVVGVPHPKLGEVPFAFVRLKSGESTSAADLEAFCRERLAGFKAPRIFEFRNSFPISGSGKIEKYKLTQEAAALLPKKP